MAHGVEGQAACLQNVKAIRTHPERAALACRLCQVPVSRCTSPLACASHAGRMPSQASGNQQQPHPQHCVKCRQPCESRALCGFGRLCSPSSTKLSTRSANNFGNSKPKLVMVNPGQARLCLRPAACVKTLYRANYPAAVRKPLLFCLVRHAGLLGCKVRATARAYNLRPATLMVLGRFSRYRFLTTRSAVPRPWPGKTPPV
jgi:hypothetical protein